jgi:AGZA family xanthine/uracil permease-like MFS transporter
MAAFIIDRQFKSAALWAFAGAVLAFFGFIHGETLGWAKAPLVALGYALFGAVCLILGGRKAAPA